MCGDCKESKETREPQETKETKDGKESKVYDFFQKMISAGWGILALSEEKISAFLEEMVHKGEISRKEAEGLLKNILEKVEAGAKEKEQKIMQSIHKHMKPCPVTKNEVETLRTKIAELEQKLAELERKEHSSEPKDIA